MMESAWKHLIKTVWTEEIKTLHTLKSPTVQVKKSTSYKRLSVELMFQNPKTRSSH